eukprot:SAG11_NODE_22815_length_399_cov_2.810000_1_plen_38_part_00
MGQCYSLTYLMYRHQWRPDIVDELEDLGVDGLDDRDS